MEDIELTPDERLEYAAKLIEQAPPGQVNDVIQDIVAILENDPQLGPKIETHLRAYNLAQFTTLSVAGSNYPTIVSAAAIAQPPSENERFVDPRGKVSFALDHSTLTASDVEEHLIAEEFESFRSSLEKSLLAYTNNHYPTSSSSVFCSATRLPQPKPAAPIAEPEPEPEPETKEDDEAVAQPMEVEEPAEQVEAAEAQPETTETAAEGGTEPAADEESKGEPVEVVEEPVPEPGEPAAETGEVEAPMPEANEEGGTATEEAVKEEEKAAEATDAEPAEPSKPVVEEVKEVVEEEPAVVEPPQNPIYTIQVVGNKYNVSNFWTGRWRCEYVVDPQAEEVKGFVKVDVHYFEAGNVQLAAHYEPSFPLPPASPTQASQIITTISKLEAAYQSKLNETYADLGEKAFKSLRRALPITRQRVDWEKVGSYRLGGQLGVKAS